MTDVLTYSDFWFLSIIPMILQAYATIYLMQIRDYIGKRSAYILLAKNILLLGFYVAITFTLIEAGKEIGIQPIEELGLYVDFIFPTVISVLFYIYLRNLKDALSPNSKKSSDKRNALRDMQRDATRDVERDINRDSDRDTNRDLRRDLYRDKNSGNNNNNNNNR